MNPAPTRPTDSDVAARMAARYGTDRSRWPARIISAVVILAFLGVTSWVGIQIASPGFEARVGPWQVEGERVVSVQLEVRGGSDTPVRCAVRVKDGSSTDVGYVFVTFDRSPARQNYRIPTVVAASSVEALSCAAADEPLSAPPADYPPGIAPEPTAPLE